MKTIKENQSVSIDKEYAYNRMSDTYRSYTRMQFHGVNKEANKVLGTSEPFVFPDGESEDEDFYYQRTEEEGYGMVKGQIDSVDNAEDWKKICDLIEVIGY